ncbi:MAG: cell division protein FtsQ/DivIB [Gammaproteobacteria bacterium]|nr:cell division protein FtsQ/DivIB [Gammaproteobacteria bacterium]
MNKPASKHWLEMLARWGYTLMLLLLIVLGLTWSLQRIQDPSVIPVRFVKVEGEVRYLNLDQLQAVVNRVVEQRSFFSVTLAQVLAEVERLPWVDRASIRRIWPDTLQVTVIEQQPLARWGETALVNRRGEVFAPQPMPDVSDLALLEGETQDSMAISRDYQKIETLLQTVGLTLAKVQVDARQAWRLWTRNGLELNLGRKQLMSRLSRFARLFPALNDADEARLKRIDLRYTNGFTANWEALPVRQSMLDDPALGVEASRLAGI